MKLPRIIGPDGREWVSVNMKKWPAFGRACLDAWRELDGRDHSMFRHAKSITVPAAVLAPARLLLARRGGTPAEAAE